MSVLNDVIASVVDVLCIMSILGTYNRALLRKADAVLRSLIHVGVLEDRLQSRGRVFEKWE